MNLDDMIPEPEHRTRHSHVCDAPPEVVWDELHGVTMSALPLGRTLEAVRPLPARLAGRRHQPLAGRSFVDVTPIRPGSGAIRRELLRVVARRSESSVTIRPAGRGARRCRC